MGLTINIRRLESHALQLVGEMPAVELDLPRVDEMIRFGDRLRYDLKIERQDQAFLVHGHLEIQLLCECVRCLKRFDRELNLSEWTCFLPLDGDEKVLVTNDSVDLTPYVREDIVLALPQHPLCEPDCGGFKSARLPEDTGSACGVREGHPIPHWSDLDKLKL